MRRRLRSAPPGQALVELLALAPLLLSAGLVAAQLLAAGACHELAGHAAEAAAAAILQNADPRAAARDALPGWSRRHVDVTVHGRSVVVRLAAPALVPGLAERLRARAVADAGPSA